MPKTEFFVSSITGISVHLIRLNFCTFAGINVIYMNTRLIVFLFSSLVVFSCTNRHPSSGKLLLDKDWKFRQMGTTVWHAAEVPGTVHTDLLKNGLIDDPYFRDNESKLQWIGMADWEYKTIFNMNRETLDHENVSLVFEGIDTRADVYLNDSLIFKAANMFRTWKTACKELLKEGKNELRLVFHSTITYDSVSAANITYKLPDTRGFTRKAPYQYGWDWGPRFVTCGMWKPVFLKYNDEFELCDVNFQTESISKGKANLSAHLTITSSKDQKARVLVYHENLKLSSSIVHLNEGDNDIEIAVEVNDPKLWWTNGLGESYLYDFRIRLQDGNKFDEKTLKYGIRTLKVIQDENRGGSGFGFELNGHKVFMKGANYIPQDNFIPRVTDERYETLIKKAADANMNMLRVWGGGIYEKDIFYDLCDKYGILVWQDFMFACNLYPGDSIFLNNVREEAKDNVIRLRNHPCLGLWCGNNEINEGWYNWGWQKQLDYTPEDSAKVWNDYLAVFENILPKVISEYDPGRFYWPSSPKNGWGHAQSLTEGDCHYWGVWWGNEPFEIYEHKVGRFMSEYGFQGFPDGMTINSFTLPDDRVLTSAVLKVHQKHPKGMELIDLYMKRDYPVTDNFEVYNYLSQLCQAYGITKAIEAHRRAMPYCMGTLYWQLNDCWPVISWSGLDYYYRPKALQYFLTKAYSDVLLSFENKNGTLVLYGISDRIRTVKGSLELSLLDFNGQKTWTKNNKILLKPNTSRIVYAFTFEQLPTEPEKNNSLLRAEIKDEKGAIIVSAVHYFVAPVHMDLPECTIHKKIQQNGNKTVITLSTNRLAKNVFLAFENIDGSFSDNYFDLLPGETKEVVFHSVKKQKISGQSLKILSMNSIRNK